MKRTKVIIICVGVVFLAIGALVRDAVINVRYDHKIEVNELINETDDFMVNDGLMVYREDEWSFDRDNSYEYLWPYTDVQSDIKLIYGHTVEACGIGKEEMSYCTIDGISYAYSFVETDDHFTIDLYETTDEKTIRYYFEYNKDTSIEFSVANYENDKLDIALIMDYKIGNTISYYRIDNGEIKIYSEFDVEHSIINYEYNWQDKYDAYVSVSNSNHDSVYTFSLLEKETRNLSLLSEEAEKIVGLGYLESNLTKINYELNYVSGYDTFLNTICFVDGVKNTSITYYDACLFATDESYSISIASDNDIPLNDILQLKGLDISFTELTYDDIQTVLTSYESQMNSYLTYNDFNSSQNDPDDYDFGNLLELDKDILDNMK